VAALLPSSHQPAAHLAAWTVAKQTNGDVYVTIRELHDPAGLQSRVIHPAALPSGSGIAITDKLPTSEGGFTVSLVQASQQCTGT
jgi:hypothetical protein